MYFLAKSEYSILNTLSIIDTIFIRIFGHMIKIIYGVGYKNNTCCSTFKNLFTTTYRKYKAHFKITLEAQQ